MRKLSPLVLLALSLVAGAPAALAAGSPVPGLPEALWRLPSGRTRQVNALWGETPTTMQFGQGRSRVVIADLRGPGIITMIHFALPQKMRLDRDLVLRIYWDGERTPSVASPLVDFFCDPNGALERVDSLLVNKKRGWNCYFPMPFARSARLELECDNPRYPGGAWADNPCYSYVIYRELPSLPADAGYFHACWRQRTLLLGKEDYPVLEARGRGQFIGWNCTVRGVGSPEQGYPVDENVKFYVDGEAEPSIEWQGLEDSFGFSWGFPEQANAFPRTGYQPFYERGAAAYRFTLEEAIGFQRSLRVAVGFGAREAAFFREMFSLPGNPLQLSSVAYWYQREPHQPFAPLPERRERRPAFYPAPPDPAVAQRHRAQGYAAVIYCGREQNEDEFLETGWDYVLESGYLFSGHPWTSEVKHCWADFDTLRFALTCPRGTAGTLELYLVDGDSFAGGRRQSVTVAGKSVGEFQGFQAGRWLSVPVTPADTASGRLEVAMKNLVPHGNAVVSLIRFRPTPP